MSLKVECLKLKDGRPFLLMVAAVLFLSTINCQLVTAQVSALLRADSIELIMGDPVQVSLTIKHPNGAQVTFPIVDDTLGSMEVSSISAIDTSTEGNNTILTRKYMLAAYDSGEYHAGPVQVLYKDKVGGADTFYSNVIDFTVTTLDIDTTKPIKAIKPPLEVPYVWQEFTYCIIGGVLLLAVLVAGFFLYRIYKKNKPAEEKRYRPKESAHAWARRELKKLEEEQLWQKGEVKKYYSRLTEILRLYLEYRFYWMAIESTTEEMQVEVHKYGINDVGKALMFETLRTADLVKFAKLLPAPDVHTQALQNVRQFVEMTALPDTINETKK